MKIKHGRAVISAELAAVLYAINSPVSKLLLDKVSPSMMAALLYLGAGTGLSVVGLIQKKTSRKVHEVPLSKSDLPYTIGMILLDIAAPIFIMTGLNMTTAANVSLLNNFEIVATSLIALRIFKEVISRRLWLGITLVTAASIILSVEDASSFAFSPGSLFVLLACICWGFENNCTRKLSVKNPLQIVVIKGLCSGTGSLLIALIKNEWYCGLPYILITLFLGFIAYGLSIFFYIYAQRELGAAKTSTYYASSPFIGAAVSLIIFREKPTVSFIAGLVIMTAGTYFASTEDKKEKNNNEH